jgi:CMP-N-acetylneuraminic acid synthetase
MKPICFIAARGGSKGIPNKNIKIINGKPLIAYTIEKALKSKIFSNVIVSTDSKKIASISKKYGASIPFIRPKNLATSKSDGKDVILHGIKMLKALDYDFDILVSLDCTVPFLKINDIKKSIKLIKTKKSPVVCGVYKQHLNPYFNIAEINSKGYLKLVKEIKNNPKNRQDAPVVYQLNGLYTIDTKKFLKNGKKIFKQMYPCEIPIENGLMIDTKFEFKIAKLIIENSK